jgi:hypothetical protein
MGRACSTNRAGKGRRKETTRKIKTWMDNIKMDLRKNEWSGTEWTDMAQDKDQWRALVKFLSSCTTGGFSRRAQLHEVSYMLV